VLHSFQCASTTNGCNPQAGLTEASDGLLYGTTNQGGAVNEGTVFKIVKDGSGFAVLHSFQCAATTNGCSPLAGLTEHGGGLLYGTTNRGGATNRGTAFKIAKDGSDFSLIHSFVCDGDDGCKPTAALTAGGDGNLYGTTFEGGFYGVGAVYRLVFNVITPTVSVAATDNTATEEGPTTGRFTVSRTGDTGAALAVNYTVSGSATSASDFQALTGNLLIPAGQSSATITVTPIDDAVAGEGDETVIVTLTANAAYLVGAQNSATVTIADNDTVPPVDSTAPGKVANLKAGTVTQTSITLNWTAPGDDGSTGTASSYDLRYSTATLNDASFAAATQVSGEGAPLAAGSAENITVTGLLCGRIYSFALKSGDEVNNISALSNVAKAKTAACNKLTVSPTILPAGEANVAYLNRTFDITGGAAPYDVQVDAATLPAGMSYGSQTFSGTPTDVKTFKIAAVITDAVGSLRKVKFKLKVAKPVAITTTVLKPGKVNVNYVAILKAKGGVKAYNWTVEGTPALPGGGTLGVDPATGKVTVTATAAGSVDVTFRVTDAAGGTHTQSLTLTFN
jgi:uncharacterized repeat protein (TIGR03803 family)